MENLYVAALCIRWCVIQSPFNSARNKIQTQFRIEHYQLSMKSIALHIIMTMWIVSRNA